MSVRLDKWLWAARLQKTRALASEAIRGGKVQVDGERVKASRDVRIGDTIAVTRGEDRMTVVVRALGAKRGPASEAALLYDETEESRAARERAAAERKLARIAITPGTGRPTKRDRRRMEATKIRAFGEE